jgi:hypothetical protein
VGTPAANDKLREAEFFFVMMEKHSEIDEFRYLVSAFLSALSSCREHDRLRSPDPRFKGWYQNVKVEYLSSAAFRRLNDLRNEEIHHKGAPSFQQHSMRFPDGITTTTKLEARIDISSGKPIGSFKGDEMTDFVGFPVVHRWVWKTREEPDVMELCGQGLEAARQLIQSRNNMRFRD